VVALSPIEGVVVGIGHAAGTAVDRDWRSVLEVGSLSAHLLGWGESVPREGQLSSLGVRAEADASEFCQAGTDRTDTECAVSPAGIQEAAVGCKRRIQKGPVSQNFGANALGIAAPARPVVLVRAGRITVPGSGLERSFGVVVEGFRFAVGR